MKPTPRMLRYWHNRYNKQLFEGKLRRCKLGVANLDRHGAVGLCWPLHPLTSGDVHIQLHHEFPTKAEFLGTLLHEMIHQWQHQHGKSLSHGRLFTSMAEQCSLYTGFDI